MRSYYLGTYNLIARQTGERNSFATLVVDKTRDEMYYNYQMPALVPGISQLDLESHEEWVRRCGNGEYALKLRDRRSTWVEINSRIVSSIKRHRESLA